jgi:hypothetical protein
VCNLDKHLCSSRDFKINTSLEFFTQLLEKNPKLIKVFDCVQRGGCFKAAVTKFQNQVMSIKRMTDQMLSVITVLMLATIGPNVKAKAQAALKSAIAVDLRNREINLAMTDTRGILPVYESQMARLPVKQQRGIQEAIDHPESAARIFCSISEFVVSFVCFDPDKKRKLTAAEAAYRAFSAENYDDFYLMMADEQSLFDVYTSWCARVLMDEYHRNQNLIQCCPVRVKRRWAAHIADKELDELEMSWSVFNVELLKVWTATVVEATLLADLKIGTAADPTGQIRKAPNPVQALTVPGTPMLAPVAPGTFTDAILKCCMCAVSFEFPATQQEKFKTLGFDPPKRCRECRPARMCDQFAANGTCSFGDGCKYTHGAAVATVLAVTDDAVERKVKAECTDCKLVFEEKPSAFRGLAMPKICRECRAARVAKHQELQANDILYTGYDMSDSDVDD